jgi:hypothetical protein
MPVHLSTRSQSASSWFRTLRVRPLVPMGRRCHVSFSSTPLERRKPHPSNRMIYVDTLEVGHVAVTVSRRGLRARETEP